MHRTEDPALKSGLRMPLVSMAASAGLAVVKIAAGLFGHSYALVADGIESSADIVNSLVVWGGLRVAVIPPDEDHPYGHGKAESLAGAVGALALLAAAVLIAVQSAREIRVPHKPPHWSTLVVLAATIAIKTALARWIARAGDSLDSTALRSDALHHRSDALTSLAAFIGISIALIGGPGYESADAWAAALVCVVIAANGAALLRVSVNEVMDVAAPRELETEVRRVAEAVEGVRAIEKCRIRKSGLAYLVEIHVEVDGDLPVREGHEIARYVRNALRESSLSIADVVVHIEPYERTESH